MPNTREKLKLGLIVNIGANVEEAFKKVADLGLPTCQLGYSPAVQRPNLVEEVRAAIKHYGVAVSSVWAGHTGKKAWNFVQGPITIGLVPPAFRAVRLAELKQGADFAAAIGAPSITTHVGFIPEDLNDSIYITLIPVLQELADHCRKQNLGFWFETGQETPVTLLRTIEDMAMDNLGINFDPANVILYGKANPVDALDVFGKHVKGMHAKDGVYPTEPRRLGKETPLGQGKVDFPKLMSGLKSLGFNGAVTIEREIHGAQQLDDIRKAIQLLTPLL